MGGGRVAQVADVLHGQAPGAQVALPVQDVRDEGRDGRRVQRAARHEERRGDVHRQAGPDAGRPGAGVRHVLGGDRADAEQRGAERAAGHVPARGPAAHGHAARPVLGRPGRRVHRVPVDQGALRRHGHGQQQADVRQRAPAGDRPEGSDAARRQTHQVPGRILQEPRVRDAAEEPVGPGVLFGHR